MRGTDFLYSDNIFEVARRNGLWKPSDGKLDFLPTYAPKRAHAIYSTRRIWRIFSLAAPSIKLPAHTNANADDYPFSVPVDTPLDEHDLMRINSDHYEGTEFDLTKGVQAGPFGDPARFDVAAVDGMTMAQALEGSYQRSISMFRCTYSFVATARKLKTNLLARLWFSQYQPSTSSYLPVYIAADLPVQFMRGSLFKYDPTVPFWNYLAANNYASRFYKYAIVDVFALRDSLFANATQTAADFERMVTDLVDTMSSDGRRLEASPETSDAVLDSAMTDAVLSAMNELCQHGVERVVQAWRDLLPALITKFHDGYIESVVDNNIHMERLFYPKWWLTASGYFLVPPESGKDVILFDAAPDAQSTSMFSGVSVLFSLSLVCCSAYIGFIWGKSSAVKEEIPTPSDKYVYAPTASSQPGSWYTAGIQMNPLKARGYMPIDGQA